MKTINTIKFAQQIKSNLNSKEFIQILWDEESRASIQYSQGVFYYSYTFYEGTRFIEIPETEGTLKSILKNIDELIKNYEWDKYFEEQSILDQEQIARDNPTYPRYHDQVSDNICKGRTLEEDHINEDMDLIPNLIEHGNNTKLSAPLHNEHYWEWVLTQPLPF